MRRRSLLLALALATTGLGCAHLPELPPPPADWEHHRLCGPDSRAPSGSAARPDYCLEMIQIGEVPARPRAVALLIPGMFQNARVFDVLPEEEISFARFLGRQGIETWVLHVRGIGGSDYPAGSRLDDLAIDDLPRGIAWLSERRDQKILVIGHSQGAMTLKASLAGLSRCEGGPCFDAEAARARQSRVRAAGFFAGSVALTGENLQLRFLACAAGLLRGLPALFFDRLSGRRLGLWVNDHLPAAVYDGLYRRENVSLETRRVMLDRSVDATTAGNLAQLGDGLGFGSTRSGELRWTDGLARIEVPVVQITFEHDPLSPPRSTYRDDFRHIGSKQKSFLMVPGLAHGDFQLSSTGHLAVLRAVGMLLEAPTGPSTDRTGSVRSGARDPLD